MYMYKRDLALNNLQGFIYNKTTKFYDPYLRVPKK